MLNILVLKCLMSNCTRVASNIYKTITTIYKVSAFLSRRKLKCNFITIIIHPESTVKQKEELFDLTPYNSSFASEINKLAIRTYLLHV